MRDYMKTGFDAYAEEFAKELTKRTQKTSVGESNRNLLEEYGEEIGPMDIYKPKKNPTKDEVGYSINEHYKMEAHNDTDYSVDTLEKLE